VGAIHFVGLPKFLQKALFSRLKLVRLGEIANQRVIWTGYRLLVAGSVVVGPASSRVVSPVELNWHADDDYVDFFVDVDSGQPGWTAVYISVSFYRHFLSQQLTSVRRRSTRLCWIEIESRPVSCLPSFAKFFFSAFTNKGG